MSQPLTDAINALTTYANGVTGASDTTLSDAVRTLADGYGGGGGSVLPSGYTQVDYLYLTGTQYVVLDYVPVKDDVANVRFNGKTGALFSAGVGTYQWLMLNGEYYKYFSSGNAASISPVINVSANYGATCGAAFTAESPGRTTSTSTSTYGSALDGSNTALNIGRRANGASYFSGYIYSFSVTNNGTNKVNLVPCVRDSDSVAGFYDTVNSKFYPSAGTDNFYAGPRRIN